MLIYSVEGQEKPFELDPNEECELDKGEMLGRQSAPKRGIDVINKVLKSVFNEKLFAMNSTR